MKPTLVQSVARRPVGVTSEATRTSSAALGRASFLRHVAISVAALAAYAMRRELHVRSNVLWVLGFAAVTNVALTRLADFPDQALLARRISPAFGVGAWAALVLMTGGIHSPFVAGFWLEIVFSLMVLPPVGTLLVTAGVAAALWVQQAILGIEPRLEHLVLQTGFVTAIGLLTFYASRRWQREHQMLSVETRALSGRLRDLESELEAARTLGHVGEGVARLAHGLKNTVHSLRGFAKLMEAPPENSQIQRQALEGLRLAIDRLEETARATLLPSGLKPAETRAMTGPDVRRTLDEVLAEMARVHTTVRWVKTESGRFPAIGLSSAQLREVILILAQNAAEASGASGEVLFRADADDGLLCLMVQDQGPGVDEGVRDTLFQPGTTTKPGGSGYGLFLARRLVESGGGQLTIAPAAHGGALVSVRLPTLPG